MTTNDNQNNTQDDLNKKDKQENITENSDINNKESSPKENNNSKSEDKPNILAIIVIGWLLFYLLPKGCSPESNSKSQTCEDSINYYLPKHLDLCKQVEYEKSRYRRVPESLMQEFRLSHVHTRLKLLETFGQECSDKWHWTVTDKNC